MISPDLSHLNVNLRGLALHYSSAHRAVAPGGTIKDLSGNGNDGTLDASGVVVGPNGIELDGIAKIDTGLDPSGQLEFTLLAWVKLPALPTFVQYIADWSDGLAGWMLRTEASGHMSAQAYYTTAGQKVSARLVPNTGWNLYMMRVGKTQMGVRIVADQPSGQLLTFASDTLVSSTGNNILLGNGIGTANYLTGSVDDVSLFYRILTNEEADAYYYATRWRYPAPEAVSFLSAWTIYERVQDANGIHIESFASPFGESGTPPLMTIYMTSTHSDNGLTPCDLDLRATLQTSYEAKLEVDYEVENASGGSVYCTLNVYRRDSAGNSLQHDGSSYIRGNATGTLTLDDGGSPISWSAGDYVQIQMRCDCHAGSRADLKVTAVRWV